MVVSQNLHVLPISHDDFFIKKNLSGTEKKKEKPLLWRTNRNSPLDDIIQKRASSVFNSVTRIRQQNKNKHGVASYDVDGFMKFFLYDCPKKVTEIKNVTKYFTKAKK